MWLQTTIHPTLNADFICDLLLELSPDLFWDPESRELHLDLSRLTRYWHMDEIKTEFHATKTEHPLLTKLQLLHERFKLRFCLAPSAAWASALCSPDQDYFAMWTHEELSNFNKEACLTFGKSLLVDFMQNSVARSEWNYFLECMHEAGIQNLHELLALSADPALLEEFTKRWGSLVKVLVRRLRTLDDIPLTPYQAPIYLENQFYPDLERLLSSERHECLQKRFEEVFGEWQERLQTRRSLVRGFEVSLGSEKKRETRTLTFHLPRPTREARTLLKLLFEKWLSGPTESMGNEFSIESVKIKSLGVEFESDRQLNLFDPKREEREEEWNLLGATLLNLHPGIRIGHYVAHESYWPEHAIKWQHWSASNFLPAVETHPPRPTLLFTSPKALKNGEAFSSLPQSEVEFLTMLTEMELAKSIEKIRDPFKGEERSYARVNKQWIFWDHKRARCLVHGIFE